MRWKSGIATQLPTQWMQAVERGRTSNRRLDRVRELADVGLISAVFEDHCELIQLLHGYVEATKSVCELRAAEVLDNHTTRGKRPALSLSSSVLISVVFL